MLRSGGSQLKANPGGKMITRPNLNNDWIQWHVLVIPNYRGKSEIGEWWCGLACAESETLYPK
jgi:hypothetical protein